MIELPNLIGVLEDQRDDDYRSITGITQSVLKKYHQVTPEEGRYSELKEFKPTESMLLGSYVGDILAYGSSKVKEKTKDEGIKAGVEAGRLRPELIEIGNRLVLMAMRQLPSAKLISEAQKELSIYWVDGRREAQCKGRCDLYNPEIGLLTDIKTTYDNLSDFNLKSLIAKQLYHCQLAWYRKGLRANNYPVDSCILLFLKTTEPLQIRAIRLEDIDVNAGEVTMMQLLEMYCLCREKDSWPGFGDKIDPLLLPSYVRGE